MPNSEPTDSVSTDEIHKFLLEIPAGNNVEGNECWNEQLFKYLEQGNFSVTDMIGRVDHDVQSRILEHLRNPIHDGIDVEKIYQDIKAARPEAQYIINAVFDGMGKDDIRRILNGRHPMRTVLYTSPDEVMMRYSDKTRKGKRESRPELQRVMDQLAYEGILNPQNDDITIFAGISHLSGSIDEVLVSCSSGLYIVYAGKAICTPSRKIDTTDEFVKELRPEAIFGQTYVANERTLLNTFFSGDTEKSISMIKDLGHPANYELYMQYLWKITLEDGKVTSDELIIFDPLDLNGKK